MYCSKCGTELNEGGRFCQTCGAEREVGINAGSTGNAPSGTITGKAKVNKNQGLRKSHILVICIVSVLIVGVTVAGFLYLNTGSRLVERQLASGEKYLSERSYGEAVGAFTRVIDADSENIDAYIGLAEAHMGLDDGDSAVQVLYDGIDAVPDPEGLVEELTDLLLGIGRDYFDEQEYDEAINAFEEVSEIDPHEADAYIGLADTYIALGDTAKAAEILQTGYETTASEKIQEYLDGIGLVNFDPTKQLSSEEYTVNGMHNTSEFGEPVSVDKYNYEAVEQGDMNGNGDFSKVAYYEGFMHTIFGVYSSGWLGSTVSITGENVYGPRNIKIGDTLEDVLQKLPTTLEVDFNTSYYDYYSDVESVEMISTGLSTIFGNQKASAVVLLTTADGKMLHCIYEAGGDMDYAGVYIIFENDFVSQIVLHSPDMYTFGK